jgi:hypothetical protein
MTGGPADWAQESFSVARGVAYNLGQQETQDCHENPAFKLSGDYQTNAVNAAGKQLPKAGCRLAMMLNQSLR